MTKKLVKDF